MKPNFLKFFNSSKQPAAAKSMKQINRLYKQIHATTAFPYTFTLYVNKQKDVRSEFHQMPGMTGLINRQLFPLHATAKRRGPFSLRK